MFRFFTTRKWLLWAWLGPRNFIACGYRLRIDVKINEWFGVFYDMIPKALAEPNAITLQEYFASLLSYYSQVCILLCMLQLVLQHTFLFRWRTAMVEWYRPSRQST